MIRKQKYSFPMRIDHSNGPDRRYTAATMTTKFQVPDKRSAKHSVAHRNATVSALALIPATTPPVSSAVSVLKK